VNGVTLHYLDWGGEGDVLLLLAGWGNTAHSFDGIAPAFTDRYHVMGLTRRGHGASEKPPGGFDLDTLVGDVVGFLDAVHANRVVLVGHSFGGLEMPLVAGRIPDRVAGVIFLDAVYDWPALARELGATNTFDRYFAPPDSALGSRAAVAAWTRRRDPKGWGPAQAADLDARTYLGPDGRIRWQLPDEMGPGLVKLISVPADFAKIHVPTLAIWANQTEPGATAMRQFGVPSDAVEAFRKWATEVDVANKRAGLAALEKAVPNAKVVPIQAPHTLIWYDPEQVIAAMNGFLNQSVPRAGKSSLR
jgi:pimeloyl-ACP methyl ester carboxylesterase